MAAPTPTARQTPTGWKMPDGFKTLITFRPKPAVNIWEIEVKPAGLDAGEKIDTTTMHNTRWRTSQPRQLVTMTDATVECAYDPDSYSDILSLLGLNTVITERYPDNGTTCYWGFLKAFEKGPVREGEMPRATATICPTNWDDDNATEEAPVHATTAGTP